MEVDATAPHLREEFERQFTGELRTLFERISRTWDDNPDDWAPRIADVIGFVGRPTAVAFGRLVSAQFSQNNKSRNWEVRFRPDLMDGWIQTVATNTGENLAGVIADDVDELGRDEAFKRLDTVKTAVFAGSLLATFANFGAHEGGRAGGATEKRWQVNSTNPRPSHAALSGQTVPIGQTFSNGLLWPGDPGDAGEVANCRCSLVLLGR